MVVTVASCGNGKGSGGGTSTAPTTSTEPPPPGPLPNRAAIEAVMARTVEVNNPSEKFAPFGDTVTVDDGAGGGFLAAGGLRNPSGDGSGQLVFFWHNDAFVGWNIDQE